MATAAQQWGLVPVGGSQVLLCHPMPDGQGTATSWGCLCPRSSSSSWELVCVSSVLGRSWGFQCCVTVQAGALAWQHVLQEVVHSLGVARVCWGLARVVAQASSPGNGQ